MSSRGRSVDSELLQQLPDPTQSGNRVIDTIAPHIRRWIGRPVRSTAMWYTFMYFSQVLGHEPARFEFDRMTDALADALYWYTLGSCAKEWANVEKVYYIDDKRKMQHVTDHTEMPVAPPAAAVPARAVRMTAKEHQDFRELRSDLRGAVVTPPMKLSAVNLVYSGRSTRSPRADFENPLKITDATKIIIDAATDVDTAISAVWQHKVDSHFTADLGIDPSLSEWWEFTRSPLFTNRRALNPSIFQSLDEMGKLETPEQTLQELLYLFKQTPAWEDGGDYGWKESFDGPPWQAIAEHGLAYPDPTKVVWVDQSLSIEHNTRSYLDKVHIPSSARSVVKEILGLDAEPGSLTMLLNYHAALQDANHEGDMQTVVGWAAAFDNAEGHDLGIARTYRQLGQPAGPLPTGRDIHPWA